MSKIPYIRVKIRSIWIIFDVWNRENYSKFCFFENYKIDISNYLVRVLLSSRIRISMLWNFSKILSFYFKVFVLVQDLKCVSVSCASLFLFK